MVGWTVVAAVGLGLGSVFVGVVGGEAFAFASAPILLPRKIHKELNYLLCFERLRNIVIFGNYACKIV